MKYTIYKDTQGYWRWRLQAANNEILAVGEAYYNRSDVLHVIDLVKGSALAPVYDAS